MNISVITAYIYSFTFLGTVGLMIMLVETLIVLKLYRYNYLRIVTVIYVTPRKFNEMLNYGLGFAL